MGAGAGWSELSGGTVLRLLRRATELATPAHAHTVPVG